MAKVLIKGFEKIDAVRISFYLIAFYFAILLADSIGFLLNNNFIVQNSCIISLLSVVLAGFIIDYKENQTKRKFGSTIINIGLFVGSLILMVFVSVIFWDNSYDGQTYHLQGIHEIANGWNPTSSERTDFFNSIFIVHYPKAFEKFGASVFKFSREIETAKISNLILVTAAWLLAFSYFKLLFPGKRFLKVIYATLLIINPVITTQSFSFLIDGQIASLFLILFFSFLLYLKNIKLSLVIWLFSVAICIDLKFTGLVYAGLFQFFAVLYLLFFRFHVRRIARFILLNGLFVAVSVFFISNNPYYTNISSGKHIFYPLMGTGSVNIMTGVTSPESFKDKNRFDKFFVANFSSSGNVHGAKVAPEPNLKIPFSLKLKEWTVFKNGSVLYGGFGPLFSGILVVSLLLILYLVLLKIRYRKELLLLSFFLLFTVFINPECWLARYVPQLWYFPVLAIIFIQLSASSLKRLNFLNKALFIFMAVNGSIILAISIVSNLIITKQMKNEYSWLKNSNAKVVLVYGQFKSTEYRLNKYQIGYQVIDSGDRDRFTDYYDFNPISTVSTPVLVPSGVKPYEPGGFFKMLESYIKGNKEVSGESNQ